MTSRPGILLLRTLPPLGMALGLCACILGPSPALSLSGAALTCMAAVMELCGWSGAVRRATKVLGGAVLAGAVVAAFALASWELRSQAASPDPSPPIARR